MPGKVIVDATEGPLRGQRWELLEHDLLLFGRGPDCHGRLPEDDPTASRHHFLLEVSPPEVSVRDLGSLNGTLVNGRQLGGRDDHETPEQAKARASEEVRLAHGDVIRVGRTALRIGIERDATEAETETAPPDGTFWHPEADPAEVLRASLRLAAAELGLPPPEDVAGHRLVRILGRGGMGAVYLAERTRDGRHVAVKVMLAEGGVSERSRKMFERECRIAVQLAHPHIVRHLAYGSAGPSFYCIMEHCPGGSVAQLIARRGGRLTVEEAGPLMLQALDGLAHAHEAEVEVELASGEARRVRGVVHRDLKPDNLLLAGEPSGPQVKIADFGLAKAFATAGLSRLTSQRDIGAGSVPYMPREQLVHYRDVRPVSDVWAIAATFYRMLSGRVPRDFPPHGDPMLAILEQPVVPIRKRHPDIARRLAEVIDLALDDQPERRFQSAEGLRDALLDALPR
jgi:hypothetical protein